MTVGARVVNVPADGKSRSAFSASTASMAASPASIISCAHHPLDASSARGIITRRLPDSFFGALRRVDRLHRVPGQPEQPSAWQTCCAWGTHAARCLVTTLEGAARLCCRVLRDFAVEGLQASLKGRFATSLVEGL